MRRHAAIFLLLASACGGDKASGPSTPAGPSQVSSAASGALQVIIKGGLSHIIVPGRTIALEAVFTDSNGATLDVTESALWQSSNPAAATVRAGVVSTAAEGAVDIKASYQTVSGQTTLDIRRTCEAATSTVTPETSRLGAMENRGTVRVTVGSPTCRWRAIPDGPLPESVSNPQESGDGSFSFHVGANSLATPRSGQVRIVFPDQSVIVHTFVQETPTCSYVPVPDVIIRPAPGGAASFKLITTPETCAWSLEKAEGRLGEPMTLTSPSRGVGSTTVSYRVSHPKDRASTSYPVWILPADRATSPEALHQVYVVVGDK